MNTRPIVMKILLAALVFVIIGILVVLLGCATKCPKYDIVEWVLTPFGPIIVETEKDTYSEEFHSLELFKQGIGWITSEEWDELVEEYERQKRKQEKEDTKCQGM